jgi:hypothetical protein
MVEVEIGRPTLKISFPLSENIEKSPKIMKNPKNPEKLEKS